VALLGAVAGHRPETVRNAITQVGDGQYKVRLHDAGWATPDSPIACPTGDTITYSLDDRFPRALGDPRRPLIGVQARTSLWPALLEKTIAAQDQAWNSEQHNSWDQAWSAKKPLVDAERRKHGLPPSPDEAPKGYDRLDMGTDHYQRADLLAALTGEEAEVRPIPDERQGEQALLYEFCVRLAARKPILVETRRNLPGEREPFPRHTFAFGHVYEVVRIDHDRIYLRNPWGEDAWGRPSDPPPMDAPTFWEYCRDYNADGSRTGLYSTLR